MDEAVDNDTHNQRALPRAHTDMWRIRATTHGGPKRDGLDSEISALAERIRRRQSVLCVGSRLLGQPTLQELLTQLILSLPADQQHEAQRLTIVRPMAGAGFIHRRLGDEFAERLKQVIPAHAPVSIDAFNLVQMPFRAVLTTSYTDDLLALCESNGVTGLLRWPDQNDASAPLPDAAFVHAVLGNLAQPDTAIVTEQRLRRAIASEAYDRLTHELYAKHSFIFVGYHPEDCELHLLLDRIFASTPAREFEHFAVFDNADETVVEDLYANHGIRVLSTSSLSQVTQQVHHYLDDNPTPNTPPRPRVPHNYLRSQTVEGAMWSMRDWDSLAGLYIDRAAQEQTPEDRARPLRELAHIFESEVQDGDRAFATLARCFQESPNADSYAELARLAHQYGRYDDLAAELVNLIDSESTQDSYELFLWHKRLARLYLDHLERPQDALAYMARWRDSQHYDVEMSTLEITTYRELLASADNDQHQDHNSDQLAQALCRAAQVEFCDNPGDCYHEAISLYLALENYQRAIDIQWQWIRTARSYTDDGHALESLLRTYGTPAQLAQFLEESLEYVDGDREIRQRKELATLYSEVLGEEDAALMHLETLRTHGGSDLPVLQALDRLYGKHNRKIDRLGVLEAMLPYISGSVLTATRTEIARIWQALGEPSKASEWLEIQLADEPSDCRRLHLLRELVTLHRDAMNWPAAIDTLLRITKYSQRKMQSLAYRQAATLYHQELDDIGSARDLYIRATESDPTCIHDIGEHIANIETTLGNHNEAIVWLSRTAESSTNTGAQAQALGEAGRIALEELDDSARATSLFREALLRRPKDLKLTIALARASRAGGNLLAAGGLFQDACELTDDDATLAELHFRIGEVYRELGDLDRAIAETQYAVAKVPQHRGATAALIALLISTDRLQEAVESLRYAATHESDPTVQADYLRRLSRYAHKLGRNELAITAAKRWHQFANTTASACYLARILLGCQRSQQALIVLDEAIKSAERGTVKQPLTAELCGLRARCAFTLDDSVGARSWISRATEMDPHQRDALQVLRALCQGDADKTIDVGYALLDAAQTPDERVELLCDLAELHLKQRAYDRSRACCERALEIAAENRRCLHIMLETHIAQGSWHDSLCNLTRLTSCEKNPRVLARLHACAGAIYANEIGDRESATEAYHHAVAADPTLGSATRALEDLLTESEEWQRLLDHLAIVLRALGRSPDASDPRYAERLRLWRKTAWVCLEKLQDRPSAISAYEVIVRLAPQDLAARHELAALYDKQGDLTQSARVYQQLLACDPHKLELLRILARTYRKSEEHDKANRCMHAMEALAIEHSQSGIEMPNPRVSLTQILGSTARLPQNHWDGLRTSDEDLRLTRLFSLVTPIIAARSACDTRDLEITHTDRHNGQRLVCIELTEKILHIMGIQRPQIGLRTNQVNPIEFINGFSSGRLSPTLVLGQKLMAPSLDLTWAICEITRVTGLLHQDRAARLVIPHQSQLCAIVEAARHFARDGGEHMPNTVSMLVDHLSAPALDEFAEIAASLHADERPSAALVRAWIAAVDSQTFRMMVAISGDLEGCIDYIQELPAAGLWASRSDIIQDVITFYTSDLAYRTHREIIA